LLSLKNKLSLLKNKPEEKKEIVKEELVEIDVVTKILSDVALDKDICLSEINQRYFLHQSLSSSPEEYLFIDTETTGLSGGTGTYAFLIGAGFYKDGKFILKQFFMHSPEEEVDILEAFEELQNQFKFIVSFNGKSYDVPLIKTRMLMNGIMTNIGEKYQIDLLPLSRRFFKNIFENCSLQYLEWNLFNITRADNDIPGAMIPQMYFDHVKNPDPEFVNDVKYHNEIDIGSMTSILAYLNKTPEEFPEKCRDFYAIARFYDAVDLPDKAIENYLKSINLGETDFLQKSIKELSFLYKKNNHPEKAVKLWLRATETEQKSDQLYAFIELAKYYEHVAKDFDKAKTYAEQALQIVYLDPDPVWKKHQKLEQINHRLDRIKGKIIS
jgi:uncharacterized protein YprB with RNaseH-like and TPR domain